MARAESGAPLDSVTSVASFFLSRIDTKVDERLPEGSPSRGRVALASARVAYRRYLEKFAGAEWSGSRIWAPNANARCGRAPQRRARLLRRALRVELIGPEVVNTMPEHTLRAFADHGEVKPTLQADSAGAQRTLADAAAAGIDLGSRHSRARARRRPVVLRLLPRAARLPREPAQRAREVIGRWRSVPSAIAWQLGRGPRRCCAFGRARRGGWSPYPRPLARTQLVPLVRLAGKLFATASAELTKPLRRS